MHSRFPLLYVQVEGTSTSDHVNTNLQHTTPTEAHQTSTSLTSLGDSSLYVHRSRFSTTWIALELRTMCSTTELNVEPDLQRLSPRPTGPRTAAAHVPSVWSNLRQARLSLLRLAGSSKLRHSASGSLGEVHIHLPAVKIGHCRGYGRRSYRNRHSMNYLEISTPPVALSAFLISP
jgi:hypothetical protein